MAATTTDIRALDADEALDRLELLDLDMVRRKLADPEEGMGWNEAQLDLAEQEYRRFLALHLMYPVADVVPCRLVDEIWHQHILDTQAYAVDCEVLFGQFLHHFPYFGMRGEDDAAQLFLAYETTLERYCALFGQPPAGVWRPDDPRKCGRTNCHPQRCK